MITTLSLPKSKQGVNYYCEIQGEGGISPYQWLLHEGALPEGIVLTQTDNIGILTGTSEHCGIYEFINRLQDADDHVMDRQYQLVIECSNDIDLTDAIRALQTLCGLKNYSIIIDADLNDDGHIDLLEAISILKYLETRK